LIPRRKIHDWPVERHLAPTLQQQFASEVVTHGNAQEPAVIAAVEAAYGFEARRVYAAAVLMEFPNLEEIESAAAESLTTFPYQPGLLYFREGEAILKALEQLSEVPDLIIVHGHGLAHPKFCGMACHVGVEFDIPTIGCARRLLAGNHRPLGEKRGTSQPLMIDGREVGRVYRSKDAVKPIYISPGYKCDLKYSVDIIVRCLRGYRFPEPLRRAHSLANRFKRSRERQDPER
jgi:deoxyribonuclease V